MGKAARLRRARRESERLELAWCGQMCATCAYRHGTEANRDVGDPGLAERRRLLLLAYEPFYCHERAPAGTRIVRGRDEKKLCVGHMRAMSALSPDVASTDEVMARKRRALERVREIEAELWQCECGWNVRNGEQCPNPKHEKEANA